MKTKAQLQAFKQLTANQRRLLVAHRRDALETDERDARCTLTALEMKFGKRSYSATDAQHADGEYVDDDWNEEAPPTYEEISKALGLGLSRQSMMRLINGALDKLRSFVRKDGSYDTTSNRYFEAVRSMQRYEKDVLFMQRSKRAIASWDGWRTRQRNDDTRERVHAELLARGRVLVKKRLCSRDECTETNMCDVCQTHSVEREMVRR